MLKMRFAACIAALTLAAGSVGANRQAFAAEVGSSSRGSAIQSLLPLQEKKACLVLNDISGSIRDVPAADVLDNLFDAEGNHISIPSGKQIIWSYYDDKEHGTVSDEFFVMDRNGTIDLSQFDSDRYKLEMIVGDGNQLNPNNTRYIVTVYLSDDLAELRTYELYTQDADGTRHRMKEERIVEYRGETLPGFSYSFREFVLPDNPEGTEYYLGVNSLLDEHPFIQLEILTYDEFFKFAMTQYETDSKPAYQSVNDIMLNQNMAKKDAGYRDTFVKDASDSAAIVNKMLMFLYRNTKTDEVLAMEGIVFFVSDVKTVAPYFTSKAYAADGSDVQLTSESTAADISNISENANGLSCDAVEQITVWLKKGYSPDEQYGFQLFTELRGTDNANTLVEKAFAGTYNSIEEAVSAGAADIKDELLPVSDSGTGYRSQYSMGNETYFTVFYNDGYVHHFKIRFMEYDTEKDADYIREYSEVPIVGEADPWFRITGAADASGKALDSYVIENGKSNNIDTMYGYGYQAVILSGGVTEFKPEFWLANRDNSSVDTIYVNGRRFEPGDTLSFPEGADSVNAMFSVIINDANGRHTKNYNVSFLRRTKGAKLFVAGPSAPETRSVFLDEYFEYKHDIFLANIGDEPLTDLRAELDADSVRLDSYWTLGGSGNDTLAPCPEGLAAEQETAAYGELSNTAKLRLIPDGEDGGEINGSLKIYSGDTLLTAIPLTGRAQNPQITAAQLDDAVLYVPYSYLITTNNMYDWTSVSFTLSGDLPDGVQFYPETGELYGVSRETGTFDLDVTASFTSETYQFKESHVSLTLTVKDNTNRNVYNATDADYTLLDAIGTDIGGYDFVLGTYGDEVFRSEGVLEQFVDLWLNGEKLVEGIDYDAESGSTKITVYAQTFESKANRYGVNTIAAEFRTENTKQLNTADNTNELRRTAQNFRFGTDDEIPEENDVTCSVQLWDVSGTALANAFLELRSTPQRVQTDENGAACFKPIGFGSHTLSLLNEDGSVITALQFDAREGETFGVSENTVTARKGSSPVLDVIFDSSKLHFGKPVCSGTGGIQPSNAADIGNTQQTVTNPAGTQPSGAQTTGGKQTDSPKTGENSPVILCLLIAAASFAAMGVTRKKKEEKQ